MNPKNDRMRDHNGQQKEVVKLNSRHAVYWLNFSLVLATLFYFGTCLIPVIWRIKRHSNELVYW